jgi:hypothetical protein
MGATEPDRPGIVAGIDGSPSSLAALDGGHGKLTRPGPLSSSSRPGVCRAPIQTLEPPTTTTPRRTCNACSTAHCPRSTDLTPRSSSQGR